ncbi:hypothetical protein WJX84_001937 [Apatococcus fuscideae]|uniref:DNA-(apurinic or apyrimidinic site) lyase n=1 Tax=Apatococcus fuscideae TaxID=2026836 RepID=A0AAW1T4T0_9CHLO
MKGGEAKRRKLLAQSASCLGTSREELSLDFTLPTGQSFRWRQTGQSEYTGVVANRLVRLKQDDDDVEYRVLARGLDTDPLQDAAVLQDYFNLHAGLAQLSAGWAERDPRFRAVAPFFPGARVLRQDPVECLFQFVCSSNNHISRIHGMVERLCSRYGTPLHPTVPLLSPQPDTTSPSSELQADADLRSTGSGLSYYAFPTLEQLAQATEAELRADGFGYRAKFIVGSVAALRSKPEGGAAWLCSLRDVPYPEAAAALCTLPGVGPKVAACVCLFALDKTQAIPVDTHVWQLATRFYAPKLKGKTLTPKLMVAVEAAFTERFGDHCGWAHNTLFISDLASQQHRLPTHLRARPTKAPSGHRLGSKGGRSSQLEAAASSEVSCQDTLLLARHAEFGLRPRSSQAPRNGHQQSLGVHIRMRSVQLGHDGLWKGV